MAVCAAPIIKQSDGKTAAVLSVSCPLGTYNEHYFKNEIAETVIKTTEQISKFIY